MMMMLMMINNNNNNNNNNIKLPNWSGLSISLQLSLEQNGPWHPGISSSGILSEFYPFFNN